MTLETVAITLVGAFMAGAGVGSWLFWFGYKLGCKSTVNHIKINTRSNRVPDDVLRRPDINDISDDDEEPSRFSKNTVVT